MVLLKEIMMMMNDDNEYEDEETRHNYTPMGSVGDDEDEESRRLKLQKPHNSILLNDYMIL